MGLRSDEIEALQRKWPRVVEVMLAAERAQEAAEAQVGALKQRVEDLGFTCEGMRQGLLKAQELINAIDQTAMGVFQVGGDDPELLVCETATMVERALADMAEESSGQAGVEALRNQVMGLRRGFAEIMAGCVGGTIGGEDVVWFSEIETLWEFCASALDPEGMVEWEVECSDPDAILAGLPAPAEARSEHLIQAGDIEWLQVQRADFDLEEPERFKPEYAAHCAERVAMIGRLLAALPTPPKA